MKIILMLLLFIFQMAYSSEVIRDEKGFPQCVSLNDSKNIVSFKYIDQALKRKILVSVNYDTCVYTDHSPVKNSVNWIKLKESLSNKLPTHINKELNQIENKTNVIRNEISAKEYIETNNISQYTLELNRKISKDYGQIFSAEVFKELVEKNLENKEFRKKVIENLKKGLAEENKFENLKERVNIVVSFGLGWEEKYNKTTPYYLKDFISDIKSMGLPVVFLKRNAFGSVKENVEKITPQIRSILHSGKDIIFVSLCKGTPELLAAEANINQEDSVTKRGNILGHVNLSGMLGGAFFSDYSKDVFFPKTVAPLLKLIPNDSISDSGKMVDAIDAMKNSIIEETIQKALPHLEKERLYINITGAPLSNQVLENGSPMIPILKYNLKWKFIVGASDGFLELPKTLIPEEISKNQLTLVLDSSHLLSDGVLDDYRIDNQINRRVMYQTIMERILEDNSLLAVD